MRFFLSILLTLLEDLICRPRKSNGLKKLFLQSTTFFCHRHFHPGLFNYHDVTINDDESAMLKNDYNDVDYIGMITMMTITIGTLIDR